jgi:hypothetical protein
MRPQVEMSAGRSIYIDIRDAYYVTALHFIEYHASNSMVSMIGFPQHVSGHRSPNMVEYVADIVTCIPIFASGMYIFFSTDRLVGTWIMLSGAIAAWYHAVTDPRWKVIARVVDYYVCFVTSAIILRTVRPKTPWPYTLMSFVAMPVAPDVVIAVNVIVANLSMHRSALRNIVIALGVALFKSDGLQFCHAGWHIAAATYFCLAFIR